MLPSQPWRFFTPCLLALTLALAASQRAAGQDSPRTIRIKPTAWSSTGGDDMARLRQLAGGVGWEFEPNAQTTTGLKQIGINRIRCINVDPLTGTFDAQGRFVANAMPNDRLVAHLATCREIGAQPHIILATGLHPDLVLKAADLKTKEPSLLGMVHQTTFGPTDWGKFRSYCQAYFEYVILTQGFSGACFEVANEPDAGGGLIEQPPPTGPGSRRAFEAYFKLYRNVAQAAVEFEQAHPGTKVTLGGPATTWAFTFAFGDFNWQEAFLREVRNQQVKLDFIGLHFYGNLTPLTGAGAIYPSFAGMTRLTRGWRDTYTPGVPIWLTEWGPTYNTSLDPCSLPNANHVGAAWTAAFLNQMLIEGIDRAIFLVTTDLRQENQGQGQDIWGWPALFTNPTVHGTHPKPPYHVFTMLSRMAPQRVEAMNPGGTVGCLASRDAVTGRLTVLLWNFGYRIDEFGPGTELAKTESVMLRVVEDEQLLRGRVKISRTLVSQTVSNAYDLFVKGQPIDQRAELQVVDQAVFRPVDGALHYGFALPPSSVSLVELTPE
jgi:hypothetical protein